MSFPIIHISQTLLPFQRENSTAIQKKKKKIKKKKKPQKIKNQIYLINTI